MTDAPRPRPDDRSDDSDDRRHDGHEVQMDPPIDGSTAESPDQVRREAESVESSREPADDETLGTSDPE